MLRHLVIAALVATPAAGLAAPLQPTGKWEVQYSDVACTAKRPFGDHVLAFQPSPLGKTVRYVIEGPGKADAAHQFTTDVLVEDGGPPIEATSLVYPLPEKDRRGMQVILSVADSNRVQHVGRLNVAGDLMADKKTGNRVRRYETMSADFDARVGPSLVKALDTCMADLRSHWGMVGGALPTPAKPAKLVRGPKFTSGDYPAEAMANDQKGTTKYALLIDEQGRLLDCVIDESSGIATLDAMGCQAIMQRAKFQPALDAAAKPVKSIYKFTLVWQILG